MATFPKKIVIVVEDDVANKLHVILPRINYTVVESNAYGKDIVEMAELHSPDVVLIDTSLSGNIDGVEVARTLYEKYDIPIVFIMANLDTAALERAKIAQPYGYIFKPFDEREIQSTLEIATSRHKADRELAESREWLTTILESIGDGVIATDERGCVKFMNPVAEKLTGWVESEANGLSLPDVFKIIDESTRVLMPNPVEVVLREGYMVGHVNHTILLSKDGNEYIIDDAAAPILDRKNGISGVVLTFRDITKKYKIEAALEASERRFRTLIENSEDMITLLDSSGAIIYGSPAIERILGFTFEEYKATIGYDIIHPEDREISSEKFMEAMTHPCKPIHLLHRVLHKNGSWIWIEGTLTNMLEDRDIGAIVCNFRDVTARRDAEQALEVSERRFRALIENSDDMVSMVDASGKNIYSSPACERILGYTNEEYSSKSEFEYIHPDDVAAVVDKFSQILSLPNIPVLIQYRLSHKNGNWLWIEGIITNLLDDPAVGAVVSNYRDITVRKLAEDKVIENLALIKSGQDELRKSEEKYRLMFDHNPQPMWIYGANTFEFLEVNTAAVKHYGYSKEEFKKMTIKDILPKKEFSRLLKTLGKHKELNSQSGEWQHLKKNGEIIYVEIASHTIMYGTTTARHIVVNDITHRKQAEEKSRIYERALHNAVEGIIITDATLRDNPILFANDGFYDLTGYGPDEVLGRNCRFLQGENTDTELVQTIGKNISEHTYFEGEILNYKKDGTPFWNFLRIAPVPDENGKVTHFVGFQNDISKRKKAEAEIEESEEKYRSLIENSPDIIMVLDRNYDITYINNVITGFTKEDVIGTNAFKYVPPESEQIMKQTFEEVYSTKKSKNFDVVGLGPNGSSAWYTTLVSPIFSGNDIVGLTLMTRDITDRKNAEEVLLKNRKNLRDIVDAITVPMVVTNSETGKVLYSNLLIAEMLAVPKGVFLKQQFIEYYLNHEDKAIIIDKIKEQHGVLKNYPLQLRLTTGEVIWVLMSARTIIFAEQPALAVTMYDITELKVAEQKLQEHAHLLELVHDAIIVRNLDDKITYWSSGAARIYGFTSEEAIGKFAPDLIGVRELDDFYSARAELFTQGNWTGEFHQRTKEGKIILVQSRWKLVRNSANEPTSILVTNTDITERKSLEQQLFRSQRLESIGALASGIAHDLNNILTPAILGMELLKLKLPDESNHKRIDTVISTIQRGSGLIGQVLSFARGAPDERESINMNDIIDEVAKIARETFPRDIDVALNLPTEALMVKGNTTQLHQILMNLCINSRDAMNAKGGTLSIEASYVVANESLINKYMDAKAGSYVLITVRDTGKGIPHSLQDKIFEPFYTTKELGKGTGIGLTTVFSIVRNLGGFIGLYSEVNIGTAFSIYLPADIPKTTELEVSSTGKLLSGNGETILLVDDEDLIRNVTEDILQTYGYNVILAKNGAEAIQLYTNNQDRINLVITDTMMPVMGGIELMGILRNMNPTIRFIAASGVMQSDSAKVLYAAGAKAILLKPFTVDKLLNAIREVLE